MALQFKMNDPAKALKYFEDKMAFTTGPVELDYLMQEGAQVSIIDVRAPEDYAKGHIPGAINLPEDRWQSLQGLSKDRPNVVYCYTNVCQLAARASIVFARNGFSVIEMQGGFESWEEYEMDIETGSDAFDSANQISA